MDFKLAGVPALLALAAVPVASAQTSLHGFASGGVSSVESPPFLSVGAGVVWTPGGLPLLAELQYDSGRREISALSLSLGARWRVSRSWQVSPLLVASGGVVRYHSAYGETVSGIAVSLGGGIDFRVSARASVFVEGRLNAWLGGSIGDGIDGTFPLRCGIALRF